MRRVTYGQAGEQFARTGFCERRVIDRAIHFENRDAGAQVAAQ